MVDMASIHLGLGEQRLQALDRIAYIGQFRTDELGEYTEVDKRWCEISGVSPQDALGAGWLNYVHPEDQLFVASTWQESVQKKTLFDYEFRFVAASDIDLWVHVSASAYFDDAGNLMGFNGFIIDTTKHKQAEISLQNTKSLLLKAERFGGLGMLIADIAHEISNPVSFVHSGAQSLESELHDFTAFLLRLTDGDENERVRQVFVEKLETLATYCRTIVDGSGRIKSFVGDLRNFSNLDKTAKQKVNIADLLQATLRLLKLKYKDYIEFQCDLDANPQIDCWPDQLNQVFMNVMINACQAMQTKHKTLPSMTEPKEILNVQTYEEDGQLVIRIKDTGCGIQAQHLNHIFDPFFTTKSKGEGTGLGLSISSEIITKHGGKILVDSKVDIGTDMTILLPLQGKFEG